MAHEHHGDDGDALTRWCRRAGVDRSWHDIWGGEHAVDEGALRTLLAELGVPEPTPEALAAAERRDWQQPLPPVLAVPADAERVELVVRVPAGLATLRFSLTEEGHDGHAGGSGPRHEGELPLAHAAEQARAEFDGQAWRALRVALPVRLPLGYHRLRVQGDGIAEADEATLLVAAPPTCWRPDALRGDGRVWGPALQLYALRSERNWGMGDYTDLAQAVQALAERGAGLIGLNPMHALFPHNPWHVSPYSPSSRSQLNVLYLDVEAIDDFRDCEPAQARVRSAAFQQRLQRLREAEQVDYPGVSAAKFEVLELLYAHFRERHLRTASERGRAFRAFQSERGQPLRRHATFEALQQRFHREDPQVWGWPVWPEAYRQPDAPEVRRFQHEQVERVEFFEYLQWQADQQLARAARRCRERGLAVGLYLDLAVSVDRAGSDMWSHQALYSQGASVGAPPDELNTGGQDWGLLPMKPQALLAQRCRFFIDTLRANMRHAAALRIDHVMGLMRLYWIAPGFSAREGGYVHYPLRELMAIVALESERNRCLVIGEDLGTVADEMRSALQEHELLSYRLLMFERHADGSFKAPGEYPKAALVAVSTHDLPTLTGWWQGSDLLWRQKLGLYADSSVYESQLAQRAQERVRLLMALQRAELLPEGIAIDPAASTELTPALAEAVHAYVARTPSWVMVLQLEDALGLAEQANLPGTVDEHPNWRRKLPLAMDALLAQPRVQSLLALLARERPHAPLAAATRPRAQAVVPRATYRLQFHKDYTLADGERVLPYLKRLGISHVYCSPLMRARAGSTHGYDVVAHDEINPELGGREAFERFANAARALGMGLLLDMVPNHMGIGGDNAWWMDVLEHGQASAYARYFDISWHPADPALQGKVLLPVLGDQFGKLLEAGELKLAFEPERGGYALRYYDHRFPLDPRSTAPLLAQAAERVPGTASIALQGLAGSFAKLPARDAAGPDAALERQRDSALLKASLQALLAETPALREAIEAVAAATSADADALDALHEAQAFRLAYWRVAGDEINYRRFFDVNDLAALRMEEPAVFEATHGYALELCAAGLVDGLRIDHPDGLHDPAQYFERLQQGYARRVGLLRPEKDERGRPSRPLYVVAEKIAAGHEDVPDTWALHGTTGYRYANVVNGVLIDTTARERFDRLWARYSGDGTDFEELAYEGKQLIMRSGLAAELTVLATELLRIARAHRRTRDHTFNALRRALAEVAACMPVYRTYIVDQPSAQDQRFIEWAVGQARRRARAGDISQFDFVRQTLLGQAEDGADERLRERVRHFAMRFQQFSAPVTAKGVEDTAFYRYHRLVALNEVGGEPGTFGMTLRGFHAASADRAARWPHTILATSTHDNKRSEDVRCRLDVLSELPAAWRLWVRRFSAAPQLQRARLPATGRGAAADEAREPVPSRADEYLLLQTLLGTLPPGGLDEDTLPAYRERIERYMLKAAREAKRHTSWLNPNADYEDGLLAFVRSVLGRVRPNPVLTELQAQADVLAWFGALNSLAMVLLKFVSPGVPDLYQGNELMDLSLVDPDNRRPVDYAQRSRGLDELAELQALDTWRDRLVDIAATPHDGRLKLWFTWRLLQLRQRLPALFRDGDYTALHASGPCEDHVVAFVREHQGERVIAASGRLYARLQAGQPLWPAGRVWDECRLLLPTLPEGSRWRNWLSGEVVQVQGGGIALSVLFATLPGAVLVREDLDEAVAAPPPPAAAAASAR